MRETFHSSPLNDPAFAHLDARHSQPAYRLVERFVIHTTPELCGELWKPVGPFTRASARRIVVRELTGGPVIFDTDECYDVGNASNKLELWLAAEEQKAKMRDPAHTPTVGEALADPAGFVEGMTEAK